MGIEALKKQLAEGTITQEEFLAELKKLLEAGSITQEEHDATVKTDNGAGGNGGMSAEEIRKLIQSETDKVRTEYANKLKAEKEEKEKLLKEKMSDEEKAKYERDKLINDLKEREAALSAREVALHTIDKLTEAKLPLAFKDFLVGASKEDADKNISAFQTAWQTAIKAEVDEKFKQGGSNPPGKGGQPTKKWSEMTLTERGKLLVENPGLAKTLAAASGEVLDI